MYPVLFRIGDFSVHAYGVMLAVGFAAGIYGLIRGGRKAGVPEEKLLEMSIWIMAAAIVGARLFHVLLELPLYLANPLQVFMVRSGGLSFHGGLIFGILTGLIYTHRQKLPQGLVADLVAPNLALGYAFVRLGCLLNGCCFGRPTALFWALPTAYTDATLRHPTQLYASAAAFLIYFILRQRGKYTRFSGQLFWEFLFLYSVYRFGIEFLRETTSYIGFLTLGQAVSLVGIAATFVVIRIWPMGRKKNI